MDLSLRLEKIASMVDRCEAAADIGTDHGYIPIYLIKNNLCKRAIAADINKGPVEKAKFNIRMENLEDRIECRLGGGLTVLSPGEVQCVVIAGMGGNLIRDIIEERLDVFKKLEYAVLQPVQNPEVLRKYIYSRGYSIIDEELCIEENKFYEIMKVKYAENAACIDEIYYEVSKVLVGQKHPLIGEFIQHKINKYEKILKNIDTSTELAKKRSIEVSDKIAKLKELLKSCI